MRTYIALIHKEADSDFGVSFPDFPGLATAGKSLEDARAMAEEALAFHIEGLVADGEAIPEPSDLDDIMADPENREGVAVLIAGRKMATPSRVVRLNITAPGDVLGEIDRYVEAHGLSRSGFLISAAQKVMKQEAA
jgi:predicted RNase H-like HicB family nuclease